MKKVYIFFDFAGTLVKMRPATLLVKKSLLEKILLKYSIGIITGAKRTETQNILRKLRIEKLFEILITTDDTNYEKPNPKLFPKVKIAAYVGDARKDQLFAKNRMVTFFRVNKKYNINQVIGKLI